MKVGPEHGALAMAVLLAEAVGLAQTPAAEVRLLSLDLTSAEVELRYEAENREQTSKQFGSTTRYSTVRFHEMLELGFRGYAYHPRLLELSGKVGLDVEQSQVDLSTPGERRGETFNGISPRYSITGMLLAAHPVSLGFGLDHRRITASSGVGDLAIVDTWSERANLYIKANPFPMELFYSHLRTTQDQLGLGESRDDETTAVGFTMRHYAERSSSRLDIERRDRTEDITNASAVLNTVNITQEVTSLSFSNNLRLGRSGLSALTTQADYRDETGSFASRRLSLSEGLSLVHLDTLRTNYHVRVARDEIAGVQNDLVSGDASLVHQLYKSLTTTLEAHGSRQTFEDSSRQVVGGSIALAYRKTIPHGLLLLNLGAGQDITDERGGGATRAVADESHTLTDGVPEFLDNPDVVAATVVVRNAANQLCLLNVDYELFTTGRFTEIRRVFSSLLIPNGGSVLVNYSYQAVSNLKFSTLNTHWRAEVNFFQRYSLYAGTRTARDKLISGIDAGRLQDVRDTLIGAAVTWGQARLRAEHQDYDSNLTPYKSNLVSFDISHQLTPRQRVQGSVSVRRVDFGDGGNSAYDTIALTYQTQPTPAAAIQLTLGGERFDDRGSSGVHLYSRLEASYRIRATHFALTAFINDRDDEQVRELTNSIIFSIRRTF
ncbi:MAG: hypothetical protein FJ291_10275 [Planctomycetes bacterium]|nr:hypothetical protein [Planctomycetota bacterium]